MDLRNLKENRDSILAELAKELNKDTVRHIRYEIDWLLSKADDNAWNSLEEAFEERISTKKYSDFTRRNKHDSFRHIQRKLYPGSVPGRKVYCHCEDPGEMLKISKGYEELNPGYRSFLDSYVLAAKKTGKKRDTIFIHSVLTSVFLRHLQDRGCHRMEDAAWDDVASFFYADRDYGQQIRSYSYKEKLGVVFKGCEMIDGYGQGCRNVLSLIPDFRYIRKNVDYLTESEAEPIRDCIDMEQFSLKERAIMMILLYTGLRSCDVAAIKISDINWKDETISIVQQKTSEPLTIAMLPAVGNAIFEYMADMDFSSREGYLFCGGESGRGCISAKAVRTIAYKAYRLADIRQNDGKRKGTHLFRHYTATKMLEHGVQRPVISRSLGHADPDSLETYLHTDFKHLAEFALSVEEYPMSEEVWNV